MALLNQFYQQQKNEQFGDDLQIILVSVDPARDTPEKLYSYVRFFNQDFIGLTGEFLDIHRFATQLNIPFNKVPGGGDNYSIDHSGNIAIINAKGHYVGFFKTPLDVAKIKASYHSIRASQDYY
jgi:protein SCO1/2